MNLDGITIHFAHSAYQLASIFEKRGTGIRCFQTWAPEETAARIHEGEVLVTSGFWRNSCVYALSFGDLDLFPIVPDEPWLNDRLRLDELRAPGAR